MSVRRHDQLFLRSGRAWGLVSVEVKRISDWSLASYLGPGIGDSLLLFSTVEGDICTVEGDVSEWNPTRQIWTRYLHGSARNRQTAQTPMGCVLVTSSMRKTAPEHSTSLPPASSVSKHAKIEKYVAWKTEMCLDSKGYSRLWGEVGSTNPPTLTLYRYMSRIY